MSGKKTGATALVDALVAEGVTKVFGNPGTTELAMVEAILATDQLEYVLGLHEGVAMSMADGFSRATGQLSVCNLHCAPGLGNAMGAIYNAKFAKSPVIVTAGQYDVSYGLNEPLLHEDLPRLAAPLVKWSAEIHRAADIPAMVRRAAKVAMTHPKGPVFLSIPGNVLDELVECETPRPTRVIQSVAPCERTLSELAEKLVSSKRPAIIAGREVAELGGFEAIGSLAQALGAEVYADPIPYNTRFPTSHPLFSGELTKRQAVVRETLGKHDLLLFLGADLLRMGAPGAVDPMPPEAKVLQIGLDSWELGRSYTVEMAVLADVNITSTMLLPYIIQAQGEPERNDAATRCSEIGSRNWRSRRAAAMERKDTADPLGGITTQQLISAVSACSSDEVIVVEEAPSCANDIMSRVNVEEPLGLFGLSSGGLGFAMGGAIGISLARPEKHVLALVGDGSAMYAIQALWTAARHATPIVFVIFNNRSYKILKQRMQSFRGAQADVLFNLAPAMDFSAMAGSMGVVGTKVANLEDLRPAIERAMVSKAPVLLDVQLVD